MPDVFDGSRPVLGYVDHEGDVVPDDIDRDPAMIALNLEQIADKLEVALEEADPKTYEKLVNISNRIRLIIEHKTVTGKSSEVHSSHLDDQEGPNSATILE